MRNSSYYRVTRKREPGTQKTGGKGDRVSLKVNSHWGKVQKVAVSLSKTVLKTPSGTNPLHVPSPPWLPEKVSSLWISTFQPQWGLCLASRYWRHCYQGRNLLSHQTEGVCDAAVLTQWSHVCLQVEGTLPPRMHCPPTYDLHFFTSLPQLPAVSTCQLPSPPTHFLNFLFIFNWRIIALQYWFDFCHTSTWISHRYAYVLSLLNLPPVSHPFPPPSPRSL